MTLFVLATLLTQTPDSILVPPQRPPAVVAENATVVTVTDDPFERPRSTRIVSTFAGALLGALPGLGLMAGAAALRGPREGVSAPFVAAALAMPMLMAAGAYGGHRLAGGRGTIGKAGIGALVSAGLPEALFLLGGDLGGVNTPPGKRAEWVMIGYGLAALPGILFTTCLLEYSHVRELQGIQVGFTPVQGGGAVSLSGAF